MLHSRDYLAHHPELGLLAHHEMDENIPLLLQLSEHSVMKNIVPNHCEAPSVSFEEGTQNLLEMEESARPLEAQLRPAMPSQTQFDMSTALPMAAGAYFLMNGGLDQVSNMFKVRFAKSIKKSIKPSLFTFKSNFRVPFVSGEWDWWQGNDAGVARTAFTRQRGDGWWESRGWV